MAKFIDIHTHILPAVDDGASSFEEAVTMLKQAYADGTKAVILTPHYRGSYRENTAVALKERLGQFSEAVKPILPEIELYIGSEIYYQAEAPQMVNDGEILSMCDSQYVLLELHSAATPSHARNAVSEFIRHGYVPILAHIDRFDVFLEDYDLLDELLEMGALFQLNAEAVMGKRGFKVKRFCHRVLKTESVHFIASDAHDTKNRKPLLRDCFLYVQKRYGKYYAEKLFCENPLAVIEDRVI